VRNSQFRQSRNANRRAGFRLVPLKDADADGEGGSEAEAGIEVQEEELGAVIAQRMYKMRCGCGRSWFELELKKFVTCPACRKLGLVTPDPRAAG
jgi:hypothetical protein